MLKIEL